MNLSKESIEINRRAFQAIDMLIAQKQLRGFKTFTTKYGLNYGNTHVVRSQPETNILKPEILTYLARDFGINSEWLVLGKGGMFKKKDKALADEDNK